MLSIFFSNSVKLVGIISSERNFDRTVMACLDLQFISGFSRFPMSRNDTILLWRFAPKSVRCLSDYPKAMLGWPFPPKKGSWQFLGKRLAFGDINRNPWWNRSELFTSRAMRTYGIAVNWKPFFEDKISAGSKFRSRFWSRFLPLDPLVSSHVVLGYISEPGRTSQE